jgi:hypothetical protein
MAGASLRSGTGTSATRLQRVAAHVVAAAAAAAAASKLLPPRVEQLRHEVQAARQPPPHHTSRLEELLAARLALSRLQDAEQHAAAVTQEAASIRELQLERFAVELDTRGWTVVPPTITGLTPQRVEALRRAIYRVAEERQQQVGGDPAPESMQRCYMVLFEDRVFEEALMNPAMRCLISFLLGDDAVLSSSIATIKRQGHAPFVMHADGPTEDRSQPLGATAMFCLSDFQGEVGGATAFVPFSHRIGAGPWRDELTDPAAVGAEAINAPAGSLLVWSEATWHGAFPRLEPEGERVDLLFYHVLSSMLTEETYRETVRIDEMTLDNY